MERNGEFGAVESEKPDTGGAVELDSDSYSLYCFLEEYDENNPNHEEIRKLCRAADKVIHPH